MKTLREKLLAELKANPRGYPTWWTKERLNDGTTNAEARKEFKRMEREGLVSRVRSHSNCIVWWDKDGETVGAQEVAARAYKCAEHYREHTGNPKLVISQEACQRLSVKYQKEAAKESAEARKLMGIE